MSKGLKQMVAEATEESLPPVQVSPEATRMLAEYLRQWAGWPSARLVFGDPRPVSPWASTDHETHTFKANIDTLLLNPNRVLLSVTPFRMRQEAVLTGALLHEAGHARHSKWLPRNAEEAAAKPLAHSDGTEPTRQTIALARLIEEPRIEGLMARDADRIGATGLGWTMRATAAHILPATTMPKDPNAAIMSLVRSWLLRAGRQRAIAHWDSTHRMRNWVGDFTAMVSSAIAAHLQNSGVEMPQAIIDAQVIMVKLAEAVVVTDDTGPTLLDMARDVLGLLFPETPPEEQPEADGGCSGSDQSEQSEEKDEDDQSQSDEGGEESGNGDNEESEAGEDDSTGEGDESGEQGEGNTEPEDEGKGDEPGAGDTGDDEDGEPEPDDEGESEEGEGKTEPDDEAEQDDQPGEVSDESDTDDTSELAKALAAMEARAGDESEDEAQQEAEEAEEEASAGAGAGASSGSAGGWRRPTSEEREIQKGAEKFLRELIAPSESSKVHLTESPSATVDGAALAAWKAGGQVRDPRFFVRTHRTIEPSPPVQIAVTCDISGSMDELQKPTAILSWALSSAALDLRNFAGRGQQIESTLVHWGDAARVIQRNGETLPGIREWACNDGTQAMGQALRLVEQEMPGFFEVKDKPVNRLLVCFTDWELWRSSVPETTEWISRALEAGVNIISVVPADYRETRNGVWSRTALADILGACKVQRGRHSLLRYNPNHPSRVWDEAAKSLATQ